MPVFFIAGGAVWLCSSNTFLAYSMDSIMLAGLLPNLLERGGQTQHPAYCWDTEDERLDEERDGTRHYTKCRALRN